jgi:transcriptional regulator with XRE-family HTH domain
MNASPHAPHSTTSPERASAEEIVLRIQQVLASRGLTLSEASRESRLRYPNDTAYRIPHHFYADLRSKAFSPRMEQVLALSAITNYRLVDWLGLFGFRLDDLAGLAASLPAQRTVLLDSSVYDDEVPIEWFRSKVTSESLPAIAPLGQFLQSGPVLPLKFLLPQEPSPFLYAKVGRQDAFAFPDLLPGSIVRIDTRFSRKHLLGTPASQSLFLVEHSKGLTCCRLHLSGRNFVTLRSTELPFAELALQLGSEARLLGKLDLEFRFLENAASPEVAHELAVFGTPQPLPSIPHKIGFAEFAKEARHRTGLSLRDASARSRLVAEALSDARYFCGRGTLSAYETTGKLPRRIHKILALSAVYSLGFWNALGAAVGTTEGLGRDPIPPAIQGSQSTRTPNDQTQPRAESAQDFLSSFAKELEEIPFFLRNSLSALTGLDGLSLRNFVRLRGQRTSFHPYLRDALLGVVDRRQRRPPPVGTKRLWEEPLYVLLRRDGSYLCARCALQEKTLVVPPFADGFERPVVLRDGVDAEVVGKVAALVRRL